MGNGVVRRKSVLYETGGESDGVQFPLVQWQCPKCWKKQGHELFMLLISQLLPATSSSATGHAWSR